MIRMILLSHITIALSSLLFTSYLYFRPSKSKFYASYGLIAATLTSGTYLVISAHSPLLPACTSGLVYTIIASSIAVAARKKYLEQS